MADIENENSGLMKWYVVKVQSNREKSIRDSLVRRVMRDGMEAMFGQIVVPVEKIIDNRSGKKRVTEQKLFPGYLLVEMILDDETWFLVRSVSGVGDFTGSAGKPVAMHDAEVAKILARQDSNVSTPSAQVTRFQKGASVTIVDGAFDGFKGLIDTVDDGTCRITVLIEIFGRPTPIDLEPWQVTAD